MLHICIQHIIKSVSFRSNKTNKGNILSILFIKGMTLAHFSKPKQ